MIFIGDGEDEQKIRNYIHQIKMDDAIELQGKKKPKEIAACLNSSDAFIMGSYTEGWSTTLVEACACGIPCVVTDFSSASAMVHNGKNGYIVQSRDEQVFAQSMLDVLKLDRKAVIDYDKQFERYALSHLKDELLNILEKY